MKSKTVYVEAPKKLVQPSPGFEKKLLSEYHLDMMLKCQFECGYCSTDHYLRRFRGGVIAEATLAQLGQAMSPGKDEGFNVQYKNLVPKLRAQLNYRGKSFGYGKTLVFSMLTDGFSPFLVQQGDTKEVLEMLVDKTSFRIRVLTKNAAVGSRNWINFFSNYSERFVVGLSLGTLDNEWAHRAEKYTSPPTKRAEATRRLQDAGVPTFGMLCPIFPTQYARLPMLEELANSIRPRYCEDVWVEPYNDRLNWERARDSFDEGSENWETINQMFSSNGRKPNGRGKEMWSRYATDLLLNIREIAEEGEWSDKLKFLLYEHDITESDAAKIADLKGVMLQSDTNEDGRSKSPYFAKM